MKREELYWLAGWLEGEGSFQVRTLNKPSGRTYYNIAITAPSTDLDVLERVQSLMGGNIHGPYNEGRPGSRPIWRLALTRRSAVVPMMEELLPLMGQRRQEQIKSALDRARHGVERISCEVCGVERMVGHMARHMKTHEHNFGLLEAND